MQAYKIGANSIANYFSHPDDTSYCRSLSWDEMCCNCVILDCLSLYMPTARDIHSEGLISFLVRCFHVARFHFFGNPIPDREAVVIIKAVISSANCLTRLCDASVGLHGHMMDIIKCVQHFTVDYHMNEEAHMYDKDSQGKVVRSDIIDATCFFLNTLNSHSSSIPSATIRSLQVDLVFSILTFYHSYSNLIRSLCVPTETMPKVSLLLDWERSPVGASQENDAMDKYMKYMNQPGKALTKVRLLLLVQLIG